MIRYPHSSDSTTTILWDLLDESEFEPIVDQKLADDPLGKFPNHYVEQLDQYHQTVRSSHSQLAHTQGMSDHWAKSRIEEYSYGIWYLLAKLDSPMLYVEALYCWFCAQRSVLELEALCTWCTSIEPWWNTHSAFAVPRALRQVVGALTEKADEAENLYQAGIPVWYFRKLHTTTEDTIRVLRWSTESSPVPFRDLPVLISFSDAYPPHQTVFQGTVGDLNRYKVMGEYIWKQALPYFIWGSDDAVAKVKFDSPEDGRVVTRTAPTHLHSTSQAAGPSRSGMASSSIESYPYNRPNRHPNLKQEVRNKFIPIRSAVMPIPVLSWAEASECIGQRFNHSQAGRPNVNQGYVLPEPALFVTQKYDATSQHFFANYLRVRKALLYRIDKCGILDALLSPTQWRTLLGLNLHDSDLSSGTTGAAQRRDEIQKLIGSVNSDVESGMYIDFSNLPAIVPMWKSQEFPNHIPDAVCREILYEISLVSFGSDLLMADRFFSKLNSTNIDGLHATSLWTVFVFSSGLNCTPREERNLKIKGKISDLLPGRRPLGLGSHCDNLLRQHTLFSLFQLMNGWSESQCFRMPSELRSFSLLDPPLRPRRT
ncbi:hypothetical protein GGU11DRAFT_751350 [Lentinula aff. detonsa]|nr:hypothetical protein GGU11DRAFT_751350 [Lentinula aff. detonsa]